MGKVGVGFCPQNAFGSAVGVMPRLVEGVACSRTWYSILLPRENLSYAWRLRLTAWLKFVRNFVNPCSEKRVSGYWRDGRTRHCASCCHGAWIVQCRTLEPVGCSQRDGSVSSKLTVTLVMIDSFNVACLIAKPSQQTGRKRTSEDSLKSRQICWNIPETGNYPTHEI